MGKAVKDKKVDGKCLVIVESPAKAKTINKYLGSDFVVKASMGHVRDLPNKNPKGVKAPVPGVDLEHDFEPTYEVLPRGKKTLAELKPLAKTAPLVYLATDLDREGEAIAWHLAQSLKLNPENTRRVVFNEITRSAIKEAFANPRDVDMNMVDAQQARRILDRIVGYQVSPLLWKKVAGGLSAGRVQSVAVRLIVEREREIDAFMPEEFWRIGGIFTKNASDAPSIAAKWQKFLADTDEKGDGPTKKSQLEFLAQNHAFTAELVSFAGQKFNANNVEQATRVARALGVSVKDTQTKEDPKAKGPARNKITVVASLAADKNFIVTDVSQKLTFSHPGAPFITSTLQQAASTQIYFAARRTMSVAQQLYEGISIPGEGEVGLITYMRTDSRNISAEAIAAVRNLIEDKFGPKYLPDKPNFYASGKMAQEAHEAIRPTDASRTPESIKSSLTDDQFKLYRLIWQRFVASQMTSAQWNVTEAAITTDTSDGIAQFKAAGRSLAFDGYLRATGISSNGEQILPELAAHDRVAPVDISPTQHFTQGPSRYTEASLVKALEADNIGRPSTYAAIIQTIQDRNYVVQENRAFRPTDLGFVVTDKLVAHFPEIFEVKFTAHMEDQLDAVEAAREDWIAVLKEFYEPFSRQLVQATEDMVHAKAETQPSEYKCPQCGKPMVYRFGKNGRFLSCSAYPDCKAAQPIDRDGKPVGTTHTDIACPKCGKPLILRKGRFGPFLSCEDYPKCDGIVNLDRKGGVKLPSAPPLQIEVTCPKCNSPVMNLRRSKKGPWISCAAYPKCRGRVAWSKLDTADQKKYEAALEKHEAQHPKITIRKTNGDEAEEGYTPQIIQEEIDS
ncbi:MAG TPA: type I DNA topoisomerase [Phycisphaerae bacterium]|nr:type I DNA topoisomerase [Phycisphaerae bacterium]HPS52108.1 type I DNA topoisomerase [Phycisphaerae bacterium]